MDRNDARGDFERAVERRDAGEAKIVAMAVVELLGTEAVKDAIKRAVAEALREERARRG